MTVLTIIQANYLLLVVIILSEGIEVHLSHKRNLDKQNLKNQCRSFRTCHDCKRTVYPCGWCHDFGCTNQARLYCPKKAILDNVWKRKNYGKTCTEIVTRSPMFVPANVRQFVRVSLAVDDMTIYERNIICEFHVEQRTVQVVGSLDQNTVYCDTVLLKIQRNLAIGFLRLFWGGAEPYSNMVLLIVYKCGGLAQNCNECLSLSGDFRCGWCHDTMTCSLIEECPRQYGRWLDSNMTCEKEYSPYNHMKKY